MSDQGSETQVHATQNCMIQHGNSFMAFLIVTKQIKIIKQDTFKL